MKLARSFVAVMAVAALTACGDDDPTGPSHTIADFAGTWTVQSFTYVADDDPSTSTNLSPLNFGITTLTIASDGSFSGNLRLPGSPIDPIPIGGQVVLGSGNNVTIDFNAATEGLPGQPLSDEQGTYAFSNNGNTLTLVLPDVTFDHTLSGQAGVDSNLTIVATK